MQNVVHSKYIEQDWSRGRRLQQGHDSHECRFTAPLGPSRPNMPGLISRFKPFNALYPSGYIFIRLFILIFMISIWRFQFCKLYGICSNIQAIAPVRHGNGRLVLRQQEVTQHNPSLLLLSQVDGECLLFFPIGYHTGTVLFSGLFFDGTAFQYSERTRSHTAQSCAPDSNFIIPLPGDTGLPFCIGFAVSAFLVYRTCRNLTGI